MANKNKTKGNNFEREIANKLTEIYGEKFIRVPNSGAFVGGKNSSRMADMDNAQIRLSRGDIIPPESWRGFNMECKSYKDFPFHKLISNERIPILEKWINQAADDSGKTMETIVFKINNIGTYIALPYLFFPPDNLDFGVVYCDQNCPYAIYAFDDFFNYFKDHFKEMMQ